MKIALVSDWFLPKVGGVEIQIFELARELCLQGHEVHVITIATPLTNRSSSEETFNFGKMIIHRIQVPIFESLQIIRGLQAKKILEELFGAEKYEVVHGHGATSPLALLSIYVAKKMAIPTVITAHSLIRGSDSLPLNFFNYLFGLSKIPTRITAVSTLARSDLLRLTGREDIHVVMNGIRTQEWTSTLLNKPTEDLTVFQVLCSMRLTKRKRPDDFLMAISLIRTRLPKEKKVKFVLVGEGPEKVRLIEKIKKLGLSEILSIVPFMNRADQFKKTLEQASIFVLPTLKEAFSIVSLEARCMGLPVVAMKASGVKDVVRDGVHGFLATGVNDFAERILQLICDDSLRNTMAKNASQDLSLYECKEVSKQYFQIYQDAIVEESLRK